MPIMINDGMNTNSYYNNLGFNMITILSNTCVGSFVYKINQWQLNTPTTWAMVDYNSLMQLSNRILLHKSPLELSYSLCDNKSAGNRYVKGTTDDICIHYVHYLYEPHDIAGNEYASNREDVTGENIIEYVQTHIASRLNRIANNSQGVIILDSTYCNSIIPDLTYVELDKFYEYDMPNIKRILITNSIKRFNRYTQKTNFYPIITNSKKPRVNATELVNRGLL